MSFKRITETFRRLRDESGQAVTEYAVLAAFTVTVVIIASVLTFQLALLDFFQDVASVIALPIP